MEQYRTIAAGVVEIFENVLKDHNIKMTDSSGDELNDYSEKHFNVFCDLDTQISHFLKISFENLSKGVIHD